MSNFPTSLDEFTEPNANLSLGANNHSQRHIDLASAIAALQEKVGIDSSDVVTSIDYLLRHIVTRNIGDINATIKSTANSGWLMLNGATIGDGDSGASGRANADTQSLFVMLWTDHSNNELPIQDSSGTLTSRGASAVDDFNAHKRLPLPDARGRVLVMKSTVGSDFDALSKAGGVRTISINHVHAVNNHTHDMQSHYHGTGWADRGHTHYMNHRHGMQHSHYMAHNHGGSANSNGTGRPSGQWAYSSATFGGYPDAASAAHSHGLSIDNGWRGDTDGTRADTDYTRDYTDDQSQSHTHGNTGGPSNNTTTGSAPSTDSRLASDQSVLQPYLTINYEIKY